MKKKDEKRRAELQEQLEELRTIVAISLHRINVLKKELFEISDRNIRLHPEEYSIEFLKQAEFPERELQRLLALRQKRISAAPRSFRSQD